MAEKTKLRMAEGAGTHLTGDVGETQQQQQQQQQRQTGKGDTGGRRVDGGRSLTAWGRNVEVCILLTLSFPSPHFYWRNIARREYHLPGFEFK